MKSTTSYAFAIPLSQKSAWTKYVSKAFKHDFYHTWDYQDLVKDGEPMLFVYEEEDNFIAIPFTKRSIPNSNYFDFHSVYGYTGPISNVDINQLDEYFILQFQACLLKFLKKENCISVFVKFHPFFNQTVALEKMGGVFDNGKVVAVDLKQQIEDQRRKYRGCVASTIKKSHKLGFTTRQMQGKEAIIQFTNLYNQSMQRVGATVSYLYDEAYFTRLLNSTQCNAKLLFVYYEDKMISGSVITFKHGIIQAHLLATDSNYFNLSPAKFMVDEICLLGREMGMEYFHLGGGLGYKENSLFEWKLGFSDLILPHKSWRFIVDQNAYRELVEQTGNDMNNLEDFFPLYRLPQPVVAKINVIPKLIHHETATSAR